MNAETLNTILTVIVIVETLFIIFAVVDMMKAKRSLYSRITTLKIPKKQVNECLAFAVSRRPKNTQLSSTNFGHTDNGLDSEKCLPRGRRKKATDA